MQTSKILKVVGGCAVGVVSAALVAAAAATFWLHLGIRPVLSGSMRPTYAPGWAIITKTIPVSQVRAGDIIVFTPPGETASYAHRVVSVSGPADHPVVVTKGDANRAVDPWHAQLQGSTVSEVVAEVPWAGRVMLFMQGDGIRLALLALVGVALAITGAKQILRPARAGHRPQPVPVEVTSHS